VYGDKEELPVPETVDTRPECPYGISKLAMEKYAYYYYLTYQLPYVALRFSNVYGPRQNPHGEAGVVGIFTERMLEGKDCFINGDGETTRDFVYVDDVADACILALDEELIGEFNISRGVQTSVNTIADLLVEYTEYGKEVPHREAKPGEQRFGEYDSTLYQKKTGWKPEVDIQTGLKQTVEWFKDNN
jgi:UDP-glucose 4-epimerase